jgi:hypothetical protein
VYNAVPGERGTCRPNIQGRRVSQARSQQEAGRWLHILFKPDDGDLFLRNVVWLSPDYMALYPRRYSSSQPPLWESQTLHNKAKLRHRCCLLRSQHNYWFTCTTCFGLEGHHHQVQELLQSPFSFHLLCLPKLASVYTLGVCWKRVWPM